MEGSWLDGIPSSERMKLRRRMRSPEAYEQMREKVKGPEDLAKELRHSEVLAELHFSLETEPDLHEALRAQVERDLKEHGAENVLEGSVTEPNIRSQLEQGKFRLTVTANPKTHQDALTVLPEGTVQEKLPVKPAFSNQYASQFLNFRLTS